MDSSKLMDQVAEHVSVRRTFGAAYERDGLLVIPVALVAGGGGGGQGTAPPTPGLPEAEGPPEDGATGSGLGFGGAIVPLGVYVVKDGEVRFIPVVDVTVLALLAGVVVVRTLTRGADGAATTGATGPAPAADLGPGRPAPPDRGRAGGLSCPRSPGRPLDHPRHQSRHHRVPLLGGQAVPRDPPPRRGRAGDRSATGPHLERMGVCGHLTVGQGVRG